MGLLWSNGTKPQQVNYAESRLKLYSVKQLFPKNYPAHLWIKCNPVDIALHIGKASGVKNKGLTNDYMQSCKNGLCLKCNVADPGLKQAIDENITLPKYNR